KGAASCGRRREEGFHAVYSYGGCTSGGGSGSGLPLECIQGKRNLEDVCPVGAAGQKRRGGAAADRGRSVPPAAAPSAAAGGERAVCLHSAGAGGLYGRQSRLSETGFRLPEDFLGFQCSYVF